VRGGKESVGRREDWWQEEKRREIGLGFYLTSGPLSPKYGMTDGPKVREVGFHVYSLMGYIHATTNGWMAYLNTIPTNGSIG
jgi:hypothetical protein